MKITRKPHRNLQPALSKPLPSPEQAVARRQLVVKLTAKGKTGSEIAELMGVSRQRVSQLRQEENAEPLPMPHLARRLLIPDLIKQGMCGAQIARHLKASPWAVWADIRSLNLSAPQRARLLANRSQAQSDAKIEAYEKRLAAEKKKGKSATK